MVFTDGEAVRSYLREEVEGQKNSSVSMKSIAKRRSWGSKKAYYWKEKIRGAKKRY